MENNVTNPHKNGQQFTGDEPELEEIDLEEATEDGDVDVAEEAVSEMEQLRVERDSYLDQLQRSVAEFANFRRRNEQERSQLAAMVRKDVLAQFLPVIDDFERALALIPGDESSKSWATGLQMIDSKFRSILDRADAKIIDPVGEPFDPSQHEAVATDPGTSGGTVVEVYQKGYAIGDLLVRPAMVRTGDSLKTDA